MMRLFFGWLLGVETVERPVVNDVEEQLETIALHWALHWGMGAGC
jgi:hypothetical protein